VNRARSELGFEPEYDFDAAVADYVKSLERMRAQGY
jgi:nucleoside-diphosphate-sugar epimerase